MKVTVTWQCDAQDAHLEGWRIYASQDRARKGDLVGSAAADARECVIDLDEDEWFVRVIAYTKAGVEDPWEGNVTNAIHQQAPSFSPDAPSAVTAPAAAAVDVGAVVQIEADPAPSNEPAQSLQVIEGPDAERGKLVAEVNLPAAGGVADGQRQASMVPVHGSSGSTRSIVTRPITKDGKPGTPSSAASVPIPERLNHEGTLLAEVNATAGTESGFAATTGKPYTLAAGSGFLLSLLTYGLLDSNFGNMIGGTTQLYEQNKLAPYAQRQWVLSDELDLGASTTFVLEAYDEIQRVTAAGYFASIPVASLSDTPMFPAANVGARDRNVRGPEWFTREFGIDGSPRMPIRPQNTRWEYVVRGTGGLGVPAEADWKPLTPGAYITGRYVYVRFLLGDGLGMHQLKSGNVKVYARVPRLVRRGTGTPEGSVAAPPGSRYLDQSAEVPYEKSTGQGSTGWIDLRGPAGKKVRTGSASPEGAVTGDPGDVYLQSQGGTTGRIWFKREGTGNTGWMAFVGMATDVSQKSANFDVDADGNQRLYVVDSTSGNITAALPTTPTIGFTFGILKTVAANTVTFNPGGSHTINGSATNAITTQYEVRWYVYRATNTWSVYATAGASGGGSTASTTEVLTGTDTAKSVTPDALAALWEKGSDVASAATISLGEGGLFKVTGTTDISDIDFATDKAGRTAILYFADTLNITNGANLICPNGRDLRVHQNDVVIVSSEGSDLVRVVAYLPANDELFKVLASNDTGADSNAAQPWFPTNGGVTLKANQTYFFEGYLRLSRAAGTTSHTTSLLFGGTATLTSISWMSMQNTGDAAGVGGISRSNAEVATATSIKAASTSGTEQIMCFVKGVVRTNAAGTLIPQFQYSAAPGGAPTVLAGTFFRLKPVGIGSLVESGSWS